MYMCRNFACYKYAVLLVRYVSVNEKFIYGGSFRNIILIVMDPTRQQETQILSPF